MALIFYKISINGYIPTQACNAAYLLSDTWDDYSFKTLFKLIVFDERSTKHELGSVKIGFNGQISGWTSESIPDQFSTLPNTFFSLGQDADYYKNLIENLSPEVTSNILTSLGDVVHNPDLLQSIENQSVFRTSLLRTVNPSSIEYQFTRILRHEAALTDYNFFYEKIADSLYSGIKIDFQVVPNSKPPSNIHILIGRNGVGKTTILNNMVNALLPNRNPEGAAGRFATSPVFGIDITLAQNYFSGVVSVSFSAFDPFEPPEDQTNSSLGLRYHYIGLKKRLSEIEEHKRGLKDKDDLCNDFFKSSKICFTLTAKRERWIKAITKLESDTNFAEMDLNQLIEVYNRDLSDDKRTYSATAYSYYKRMSSGHAIVLLTITKLVETVEEKTLVLLDEPESHLHPPLLSAFTRALSDLLVNRNGVAIIATHSPVVLQEVPKTCVSIIQRTRLSGRVDRPEGETFGENVGILTREVFGLEVTKSGFHDLLKRAVNEGKNYDEISAEYHNQLGFEGKILLRSMLSTRNETAGISE